jgi:expansin (peptidoglycan-binding protein)
MFVAAMEITTMNNAMIIFGGIIAGLSAAGLYEAGKNTITSLKA